MNEGILISFDVDSDILKKITREIEQEINKLSSSSKVLTQEEQRRLDILRQQSAAIKEQMNAFQAQSSFLSNAISKINSDSLQFKIAFARVIQDAPFGILGMANNITFLSEQMAMMREKAIASGKSFSAFKTILQGVSFLFTSPIGLISLVTSLALLFRDTLEPIIKRVTDAFTKFTDAIGLTNSKFSNFIDAYKERVKDLIKINPTKAIPFEPKSLDEINEKIREYEKTIKEIDDFISKRQEKKFSQLSYQYPVFSFLSFLYSDDEIKKFRQRREILSVELDALKKSLAEFEAAQRSVLSVDTKGVVEVGKPFTKRAIVALEKQKVEAPRTTLENVIQRLRAVSPELTPISEISLLTIAQLKKAIQTVTDKIETEGDKNLVPKLKAFQKELERKLIEFGLKEGRYDSSIAKLRRLPAPDFIQTLPISEPSYLSFSYLSYSDAEEQWLKKQEALARATQLYAMARDAASYGQTEIADELIRKASMVLSETGFAKVAQERLSAQYFPKQPEYSPEFMNFSQNFGRMLGESLVQFALFSNELKERERELALERVRIARKANEQTLREQRKNARERLREVERLLFSQQITEEEAARRQAEIQEELAQKEEELALRRRELALEEERIQRERSNAIKRAVIVNVTNMITEYAFQQVLKSSMLGPIGALFAAAAVAGIGATLREILLANVASYAVGGIVKSPTVALVGDAKSAGNRTNEEVIFNERLLTRQAERFAAMVNNMSIVLNGRKLNDELTRSKRFESVVRIR